MTILLDGKIISTKILLGLAEKVNQLEEKPKLAVIIVGENPASKTYVSLKQKRAQAVGIESIVIPLPADITQDALLEHIDILNEDSSITGILVQMPLPEHIDTKKVLLRIAPHKDVDGFNPINAGLLFTGATPSAYPCTPLGIITLLNEYKINIAGKHAVIVGRSNIVGKPLSHMLLEKNATVTICHSKTKHLVHYTEWADLVIVAVGKPEWFDPELAKNAKMIIDVGINFVSSDEETKIVGDVQYSSETKNITPVPKEISSISHSSVHLSSTSIQTYMRPSDNIFASKKCLKCPLYLAGIPLGYTSYLNIFLIS